jgi:hypothetical protein
MLLSSQTSATSASDPFSAVVDAEPDSGENGRRRSR